jgi:hypothetical protein
MEIFATLMAHRCGTSQPMSLGAGPRGNLTMNYSTRDPMEVSTTLIAHGCGVSQWMIPGAIPGCI